MVYKYIPAIAGFANPPSIFLSGLILASLGCSQPGNPDVVEVTGTVTLDGQPVEEALVIFSPVDISGGSSSSAETDASGNYRLVFSSTQFGAFKGTHKVRFEKDGIPEKYSEDSELSATVTDGPNKLDFELSSN